MTDEKKPTNAEIALRAIEVLKPLLAIPGDPGTLDHQAKFKAAMMQLTEEQIAHINVLGEICEGVKLLGIIRQLSRKREENVAGRSFS